MFDPLRRQLSKLLTDAARKGLAELPKDSSLARALEGFDVEGILKEDIQRICGQVTIQEIGGLMGLVVQLKTNKEKAREIKADIKKIAGHLIDRVERGSGKLLTPVSCREILFHF